MHDGTADNRNDAGDRRPRRRSVARIHRPARDPVRSVRVFLRCGDLGDWLCNLFFNADDLACGIELADGLDRGAAPVVKEVIATVSATLAANPTRKWADAVRIA